MRFILFISFLVALAKSGILILIGVLIKNHLDALLFLLTRKSMPSEVTEQSKAEALNKVTRWLGLFIILLGIGMALSATTVFFMGSSMPAGNFNFKF